MAVYKNFGNDTFIGWAALTRLGMSVELDERTAREAILGGAMILPEKDFAKFFSADDEKKFPTSGAQMRAPKSFTDKHAAARMRLHEMREKLQAAPAVTAKEK